MVVTHLACCTRIVRTIQLLRQVQCSAGKAAAGQHGGQVASSTAKQEVQVAGTSQVVIQTLKRAEEEEKSCAHVSAHSLLPQTGYSYDWACASTGSMHRLPQVRQHRKAAANIKRLPHLRLAGQHCLCCRYQCRSHCRWQHPCCN